MLGTGTSSDPYIIQDVNDLQNVNNDLSAYYELGNDIDASDTVNWNSGSGFEPIGDSTTPFTGNFKGKGYVINNLYINRPNTDDVGLFGYLGDSVNEVLVQNIGLINVSITGSNNTGCIVGNYDNYNCSIKYCFVSEGSVIGNDNIGGIVGRISTANNLEDCYNTSTITGNDSVGGIVGYNRDGYVRRCYSTGVVNYTTNGGGIVGKFVWDDHYDCFWDTETSGQATEPSSATGLTTSQMKQQSSYTNWDFTNTWGIDEGNSYPYLLVFPQESNTVVQLNPTDDYYDSIYTGIVNNSYLEIDPNTRIGIIFDFSSLSVNTINSAIVYLYHTRKGDDTGNVLVTLFDENDTNLGDTIITNGIDTTLNHWHSYDVTSLIQGQNGIFKLRLEQNSYIPTDQYFESMENSEGTGNLPYLELDYVKSKSITYITPTLGSDSAQDGLIASNTVDGNTSTVGESYDVGVGATFNYDISSLTDICSVRVYCSNTDRISIYDDSYTLIIDETNVVNNSWNTINFTNITTPSIYVYAGNSNSSQLTYINEVEVGYEDTPPQYTTTTNNYEMVNQYGLQNTVNSLIDIDVSLALPPNLSVTQIDGGIRLTWT